MEEGSGREGVEGYMDMYLDMYRELRREESKREKKGKRSRGMRWYEIDNYRMYPK